MRILVVGAGVVGVTSAYWLALDGHEVEVLEAGRDVAGGASFVNAGLLALADSTVWASPSAPLELVRSMVRPGSGPIRVRASAGAALVPWGLRFLAQCTPARSHRNMAAAYALSLVSHRELLGLLANEQIQFGHQRNGMVFLAREKRALEGVLARKAPLVKQGESLRMLDPGELASFDRGFAAAATRLAGAIHSDRSGHGDCRAFTAALARLAADRGVTFATGQRAVRLSTVDGRIDCCETQSETFTADAYLLAAGAASPLLAQTAGVRVPIVPVAGLSMTVPILDSSKVPELGGVDEDRHVAFSRMGDKLRISSTAEFRGYGTVFAPPAFDSIRRCGEDLFPGALDWRHARRAAGLRPVTPRGVPFIGTSCRVNLYLNTGHGHLGWTQACGSARLLADLIAGRPPALDPTPYRL